MVMEGMNIGSAHLSTPSTSGEYAQPHAFDQYQPNNGKVTVPGATFKIATKEMQTRRWKEGVSVVCVRY